MRSLIHVFAVIVSVFILCACNAAPMSTPSAVSSAGNTSNLEAVISTTPTPTYSSISLLNCTIYLETQWGVGLGEFGLCPEPSSARIRGPYPPKLGKHGELFIVDRVNQRILTYSENVTPQIIPIPSSYLSVDDVCAHSPRWSNVSISENRLYLVFSMLKNRREVDQLAVLSLDGQEERVIDLEPYYPLHSPYLNSLVADKKGGVYLLLPPAGVVHFDTDLRPEFRYLGDDDGLLYENLAVGWDGNLYTYRAGPDILNNWGPDNIAFMHSESLSWVTDVISATGIVSPTYTRLLGADTQGRLYFRTSEQGSQRLFVRVSPSGDWAVAAVPKEWQVSFYGSDLAPDGSLYDIVYDANNPVAPRIIKCVFD